MSDGTSTRVGEPRNRRSGWRRGAKVRLADGVFWHLARIDVALLLTSPLLLGDLGKACAIADEIRLADDGGREHAIGLTIYHAHMANIGVRLLQANYDLPDEAWKGLLRFGDLHEMMAMTAEVSNQIAASTAAWFPFFLTDGPDGVEHLELN